MSLQKFFFNHPKDVDTTIDLNYNQYKEMQQTFQMFLCCNNIITMSY